MIIVKLQGGLGNQLFQYAFGQALSELHNVKVKYDTRWLNYQGPNSHRIVRQFDLDAFHFPVAKANEFDLKNWVSTFPVNGNKLQVAKSSLKSRIFKQFQIIREPHFHFSESVFKNYENFYFDGYWQSEKYFSQIKEKIRKEFEPKIEMKSISQELFIEIKSQKTLCVNVRRGDFAHDEQSRDFHGLLGNDYYKVAVSRLLEKSQFDQIYVFSDEPDWCFNNLDLGVNFRIVGHEFSGPKFSHYLKLMSAADGFVIPNSTFAWWAVWLAQPKSENVVAPRNWFTDESIDTSDLINEKWSRI